jgi:hypothetical protein
MQYHKRVKLFLDQGFHKVFFLKYLCNIVEFFFKRQKHKNRKARYFIFEVLEFMLTILSMTSIEIKNKQRILIQKKIHPFVQKRIGTMQTNVTPN